MSIEVTVTETPAGVRLFNSMRAEFWLDLDSALSDFANFRRSESLNQGICSRVGNIRLGVAKRLRISQLTGGSGLLWCDTDAFLSQCFESWGYWSGSTSYPVPITMGLVAAYNTEWGTDYEDPVELNDGAGCEDGAEFAYENSEDLWSGEQGELRRHLCEHIRNCLQPILEQVRLHSELDSESETRADSSEAQDD